tara:strand:- start:175 stop:1524 length:1350 start_codon:yes stop_codon:yes gene_type:complete
MEEQWNKFLKQIQSEITNQSFQTWFANIRLLNVGENEITIEVPNRFHYEWLDSKYDQLIQDSVKSAFDKTLSINYTVGMKQETKAAISTAYSPDELIPKKNYHQVSKLNNRYVFKSFVEGRGNQFAKAAASSVADSPGQTPFNPLLIYSNPGLGKTHLLQSIGNHILQIKPQTKVIYVTSEKFMLDFISAIQNNKSTVFAKSYRDVEVLLLDDVQFFQTKEQTQEQFFHLFNELFQQGKQIVLTTDRHPNELTQLKTRLVSRFQSGLIVDIQPPDLETRIAILMNKAKNENLDIPYDVTEFIATAITEDIRTMEGALVKLLALASLTKHDITIELAQKVIEGILGKEEAKKTSLNLVVSTVSKEYRIKEENLFGKSRQMEIVLARHVAMFLCRELTSSSLISIGKYFGNRDHSTVIHACKMIENKIKEDEGLNNIINNLKSNLLGGIHV